MLSKASKVKYQAGSYTIDVFATMVGEEKPRLLTTVELALTEDQAKMLNQDVGGVMFNWNPNNLNYQPETSGPYLAPNVGPRFHREAV